MSSLTGLGLRGKVGLGKSNDATSKPKPPGSSITGLGLRNKAGLGKSNDSSAPKPRAQGSSITGLGLRNKAAGLAGKKGSEDVPEHVSRPMSTLKDPSSFAPPPKNINYHGAAAETRQIGRIAQKGPLTPAEYQAREKEKADQEKEEAAREREERRFQREEKQKLRAAQQDGPPLPSRIDTSGLSTTQYAPPVARSTAADGTIMIRPTAPKANGPPRLPPRLSSRQNSSPETVSGFGMGSQAQYPTQQRAPPRIPPRIGTGSSPHSPATPSDNPQLDELQSRFSRMKASPTAEAQTHGTRWPEQGVRNSEGFGEQTARRWKPVDTSSGKYGSDNVGQRGYLQKSFEQDQEVESPLEMRDNTSVLAVKKAPPPRPKKKAELSGVSTKVIEVPPFA